MNYSSKQQQQQQQPGQQQYANYQPTYQTADLNSGLPFLNQNGMTASPTGQMPPQQLNYRTSNASLNAAAQGQMQLNQAQYAYQASVQSRPQSTYSIGHEASTYAPSSPGGTSFMTMSERRMSRDSAMEGMDDARPLAAQPDFYRRPEDAGSRLSQTNMSLRRGSMASQNHLDPLRRPHIAPPIFAQQNQSSASFDRRSSAYSRTYPYPHPNAPEPTAGFPYAFPDPDMGDSMASPTQPGLQNQQLANIMAEGTPYSRSPELRVSHKLAERKRRKEMKDLFDDLRDKLPLDRTLKTSKWEILSKAVEHVQYLEDQITALQRENEELRRGGGISSAGNFMAS